MFYVSIVKAFGCFLGGAGLACAATSLAFCTPAEQAAVRQDAIALAPDLTTGCALAKDIPAVADYADVLCPVGEALDSALAHLPAARPIESIPTSGGYVVRVRIPSPAAPQRPALPPPPGDAGAAGG